MNSLHTHFSNLYSENAIKVIQEKDENGVGIITVKVNDAINFTLLMTNGLSDFKMNVDEKSIGKEHIEIYFCLPDYWDLNSENGKWVVPMLNKLATYVITKNTWFGVGHTVPNGTPAKAFSNTMAQQYLLFDEPNLAKKQLLPLEINADKTIHFLALVPLFKDEFDYKISKGTYKFKNTMADHSLNEMVDDFRQSIRKSKWRLFPKR